MTRREIAAQRDKYLLLIRQLGKQRYDARPLLDEFYRLTEEFKKAGGRPAPPTGSLTRKYWEDPENYCLEHENHWPVKVVDGKIVREYVKSYLNDSIEDDNVIDGEIVSEETVENDKEENDRVAEEIASDFMTCNYNGNSYVVSDKKVIEKIIKLIEQANT